jgi:two-component system LytT family response regulator
MKVLIIDDEAPARRGLRETLGKIGVSNVRDVGSIAQAVKAIEDERPDVLLLDIHMPSGGGFKLLEKLPARGIPVIFVTAHMEHAAKAFDVEAMDYVLKPVEPKRLLRALEKVMRSAATNSTAASDTSKTLNLDDRIFLREGTRHHNVRIGDIELLESCGAYTKVVMAETSMMVWGTLASIEARLPSDYFFRVNRQSLVNLAHATEIADSPSSSRVIVKLPRNRNIELSRRQSAAIRKTKLK